MLLKNNGEPGGHVTIWRMRTARSIPKATNTICNMLLLTPLQRLLHERVSVLRYTYTACLVNYVTELLLLLRQEKKISLD